jgi:hypothetical protein
MTETGTVDGPVAKAAATVSASALAAPRLQPAIPAVSWKSGSYELQSTRAIHRSQRLSAQEDDVRF